MLIAVAIGAKGGERFSAMLAGAETPKARLYYATAIPLIALVIVLGEISAILAISTSNYNAAFAVCPFLAIFFCLFVIYAEFVRPVAEKMTRKEQAGLKVATGGIYLATVTSFAYLVFWA